MMTLDDAINELDDLQEDARSILSELDNAATVEEMRDFRTSVIEAHTTVQDLERKLRDLVRRISSKDIF